MLCQAGGTAQQDPAAPGVRAGPAMGRVSMPGPKYEALLDIKVELETEIATYCSLLEEGEDFDLVDALDKSHSLQTIQRPRPAGLWMAERCLRAMTPKF